VLTYFMSATEVNRLSRGLVHAAEIFFAAGAREIYPMLSRQVVVRRSDGVEPLRRQRLRPWDFVLTSFHPLGTCRMGRDPKKSVVDFDHQTHELKSLFIVDGSTVPGPPAVNPQLTIMAMADRAAERIAERLG
jgi:choline dehydrogenase-like flavoprotein